MAHFRAVLCPFDPESPRHVSGPHTSNHMLPKTEVLGPLLDCLAVECLPHHTDGINIVSIMKLSVGNGERWAEPKSRPL